MLPGGSGPGATRVPWPTPPDCRRNPCHHPASTTVADTGRAVLRQSSGVCSVTFRLRPARRSNRRRTRLEANAA